MKEHITVVYYDSFLSHPDAFYVIDADAKKLHGAFNDHDVQTIKNITIETVSADTRSFKTLFADPDIQNFLKKWKLDSIE